MTWIFLQLKIIYVRCLLLRENKLSCTFLPGFWPSRRGYLATWEPILLERWGNGRCIEVTIRGNVWISGQGQKILAMVRCGH